MQPHQVVIAGEARDFPATFEGSSEFHLPQLPFICRPAINQVLIAFTFPSWFMISKKHRHHSCIFLISQLKIWPALTDSDSRMTFL
jgi:hypothetical protein